MRTGGPNQWFEKPSKKQLQVLLGTWIFGVVLMLAAMTDLFRSSPFQERYMIAWFMILFASSQVIRAYRNYRNGVR